MELLGDLVASTQTGPAALLENMLSDNDDDAVHILPGLA
jgi:hypothetical protein